MTFEEFRDTLLADPKVNRKLMNSRSPILELFFQAGKDSVLTELNNQGGKIMDEKLLPCPFCGMKPEAIDVNTIYCAECDYDISMHQWNTRTCSQESEKQKTEKGLRFFFRVVDEW